MDEQDTKEQHRERRTLPIPAQAGDWGSVDLTSAIESCISDDSRDGFLDEVETWAAVINELPVFDESEIRIKLNELDIEAMNPRSLPIVDTDRIVELYFRAIRYRDTLADLTNLVQPHHDTLEGAMKSLRDTARLQAVGTDKDKDSKATATIRPLTVQSVRVRRLLNAIKEKKETADYIRRCLEKVVDERRNDAYINHRIFQHGSAVASQEGPPEPINDDEEGFNVPREYRKR